MGAINDWVLSVHTWVPEVQRADPLGEVAADRAGDPGGRGGGGAPAQRPLQPRQQRAPVLLHRRAPGASAPQTERN